MATRLHHSDVFSEAELDQLMKLFHASSHRLGEDRNTIKVVDFKGRKIVVKSFKVPNAVNKLAYRFLRKSKARRSFENAVYLKEKGIGTPDPLAYLEYTSGMAFLQSYYISELIDYDYTFREVIHEPMEDHVEILKGFTRFVHKMHEARIYFLDHSPGNTLIKRVGDSYQFYLVDLNRMRFYDIPLGDRIKNFERLAPHRWVYEIIGAEYAALINKDAEVIIEEMWMHVQQFQHKFHRKRRLKRKLKSLLGKS